MRLVADIVGTNTRLALHNPELDELVGARRYKNEDFDAFEDVVLDYLPQSSGRPREIVVAMAGPVKGNAGRLTNVDWTISGDALRQRFSVDNVRVINDLTRWVLRRSG